MRLRTLLLIILISNSIISFSQEINSTTNLSYQGSSTVGNFIHDANAALEEFDFSVDTKPESSGGELAILEGRTDIAGIARLPSKEILSSGVSSTLIGWDAIAIIVNKENPVKNLTQSQLKKIYTGEIKNWSELGGLNMEIKPFIVGMESATRKVCRSIILGKDDYQVYEEIRPDVDIISRVQKDVGGIGQISYSFVKKNKQIKALHINGQALTLTNKNYPITRPLYLLWWQGRRDVASFVEWALSNEGQRMVMNRFIGISEAVIKFEDETGDLLVYTKTTPIEDGGIFYYPHVGYDVLQSDHSMVMHVSNHLSTNDESPTRIELPIGNYIIRTIGDNNDTHEFSINITSGKLVKLYPERKESPYGYFAIPNQSTNFNKSSIQFNNSQKIDFFGDFRVRAEQDIKDDFDRFRGRFRIRAGISSSLNSQFKLVFRLVSTGDADDPNSSHVNLTDGFNQIKVAFDRAFVYYHSEKKSTFEWWLGKFSNPNISSQIFSEVLWDADIQPEGMALSLNANLGNGKNNLKFINGLYLLSQFKTGNSKNWLYTSQISNKIKIAPNLSLTLASGLYYYKNFKDLNINVPFIDSNDGNLNYLKNTVVGSDTIVSLHYQSDFHITNNFINVRSTSFKRPLTLKFQWIYNLGADTNNKGYTLGLSYGELKNQKDWLFYYQFNHIEQDAVFTPFTQDDALSRSNTIGHIIGLSHNFHKKISLHLWGLFNRSIENSNIDSRVRLDLNVKF